MIRFKAMRRQEPWTQGSFFICFLAVVLALAGSALLLALQGRPPLRGLTLLFSGALGGGVEVQSCLIKAIPIFLCSLGMAVAFRLQIWNIGAEGQYVLGAVGATLVADLFPHWPMGMLLPMMFLSAAVCGGLWGMIPGFLKLKLKANEIIITLMLNYIGVLFLEYLVYGPWKDPGSFGFPMSRPFAPAGVVGSIPGTRVHWGLVFCVVAGLLMTAFLRFTRLGFELKASGEGVARARYARMPYGGLVLFVMVLSGAMAGMAGFFETSAVLNRLQPSIVVGYGYTAIVVAWLARLNPLAIGVASFLLAALRVGVENLQLELGVPAAFGAIVEGLILLTVLAGQFFRQYTFCRVQKDAHLQQGDPTV